MEGDSTPEMVASEDEENAPPIGDIADLTQMVSENMRGLQVKLLTFLPQQGLKSSLPRRTRVSAKALQDHRDPPTQEASYSYTFKATTRREFI